jgi:hypothetical protein
MVTPTMNQKWYHERRWAAVIVVTSILSCYVFVSLAINSGSLIEYFIAMILMGLSVNRLAHIVLVSIKGRVTG